MKRRYVILTALSLITTQSVKANSGPSYWEGMKAGNLLAIDEHSPIEVLFETLTFDIREQVQYEYSLKGNVYVEYEMYNPTEESQIVQMAFPFVSEFHSLSDSPSSLLVNHEEIDFELLVAGDYQEGVDFKEAIGQYNETVTFDNLQLDEVGTLYEFKSKTSEDGRIKVIFEDYEDLDLVFTQGFNGFSIGPDESAIIEGPIDTSLFVFIVGDANIEYVIEDPDGNPFLEGFELLELSSDELTVSEYIEKFVLDVAEETLSIPNGLSEEQLKHLIFKDFDKRLMFEKIISTDYPEFSFVYEPQLFFFLYDVAFEANEELTIELRYDMTATFNQERTYADYTFDYFLSPASYWSDFHGLDIEVLYDESYQFMSDFDFVQKEVGVMHLSFDHLPEQELSFTLRDRWEPSYGTTISLVIIGFALVAVLFVSGLILFIVSLIKRKKGKS